MIIQYKQLETYNQKKSWSEHKGMRVQAHKMFYNLQHSAVPETSDFDWLTCFSNLYC